LAQHLGMVLLLSLPFLILSGLLVRNAYMSDGYAQLLSRVLVASSNERLDNIIVSYPPFANIAALVWPNALWLMILSSLAMGGILWLLWLQLLQTQMSLMVRLLLVMSFILTPITSYAATQELTQVWTLFLLLGAWISFNRFTRERITWNGFLTGLILGLGFYVSIYATIFSLFFALATPLYFREAQGPDGKLHWPAVTTGMIVVLFPVVASFLIWSYLNWIFSGEFFSFLEPARNAAYIDYLRMVGGGPGEAVGYSIAQLIFVPVYLVVGLLEVLYAPSRLLSYFAPLIVVILSRALGLYYPDTLALLTYSMTAVAAIPRHASAHWGSVLLVVAVLKVTVNLTTPVDARWLAAVQGIIRDEDRIEQEIADRLRTAGDDRIMLDDSAAYRLIARTGTGAPFLTTNEPMFELATSAPAGYVDYILLTADDRLGRLYDDSAPPGFVLEATWDAWQLYRQTNSAPLLSR
jgi:hypothetical protein